MRRIRLFNHCGRPRLKHWLSKAIVYERHRRFMIVSLKTLKVVIRVRGAI